MPRPLTAEERTTLLRLCTQAKEASYSPYSKFRVGACLLTEDGTFIKGCNVENASYGGAICAERTAVVKAVSEGHRSFLGIAVTSDVPSPISPCGICRQFLREFFAPQTPILLLAGGEDGKEAEAKVLEMTMEQILPMGFGPEDLEKPRGK
ncbi:cytidine deaminase [Atractiella rhizophila]|nr:cytidine deaminase [Atractiella rhizophila]